MAIPGSHFFDVARAARFDQFESRVLILSAVTDVTDTLVFLWVRPYALDVHPKKAGVEVDAPVEVAHQHHRVPNPESYVVYGFFAAHWFPLQLVDHRYGAKIYLTTRLRVKYLEMR